MNIAEISLLLVRHEGFLLSHPLVRSTGVSLPLPPAFYHPLSLPSPLEIAHFDGQIGSVTSLFHPPALGISPTYGMSSGSLKAEKPRAVDLPIQPSSQSGDLLLVPATPVEYVQTAQLNADEWRGPLTLEQYLDREKHLQSQDLTKDGRITGWILTSSTLPPNADSTRPILASCETIPVAAYIARNGHLDRVTAHGIGSVYTRPEHRGKGYAGRMMTELGKQLETWQQPNGKKGSFSVLYSDIGQNFYTRFGWNVFPSTHIHLLPLKPAQYQSARQGLPPIEDVTAADLSNIPSVQHLEEELETLSKNRPETIHVAIRPDADHFGWHHAREEFQTRVLGKSYPKIKGAIHQPTGIALIWCRVYATKAEDWKLHVLHVVIPSTAKSSSQAQEALAALLLRAQLEAHNWEMASGVEVWDPSDLVLAAAQRLRVQEQGKVEVIARDQDHICSLRWNRSSDDTAPVPDDNIVWVSNEKYAWC